MGRFTIIVLDSFGVGELPDASEFGDEGSNTLRSVLNAAGELKIPNMKKLGLYNIEGLGLEKEPSPSGAFGKAGEKCKAKDTTSGHYEIAGLILEKPYRTYPEGFFPEHVIRTLEARFETKLIGNVAASGTKIIEELGEDHMRTGYPIIYLSADSVLQLAMHEEVISLSRQYELCQIAREVMTGDDLVGRIIARPFLGDKISGFYRTGNRRDFAADPPGKTLLNAVAESGRETIGVGKIEDIFNSSGLTLADHTKNNREGIDATIRYLSGDFDGLLFTNLVDFDMLYGHRNDAKGYAGALEYFDMRLPEILSELRDDDLLVITADHGCDPGTISTDHSREYVPLLVAGPKVRAGTDLGVRESFSDIAGTAGEFFGLSFKAGASFLKEILG